MKKTVIIYLIIVLLTSCLPAKKTSVNPITNEVITTESQPEPKLYRASNTLTNDLLHTRLAISFDWGKKYLSGKANLILCPYFYPTNKLILDARGMELHDISLESNSGKIPLKYEYKNDSIFIFLDRTYKKGEKYNITITYTAKPDELKEGGSAAISSDRGLYFINADGKDPDKPQQIWTQGETQSNSVWFPTIDSPNERMTQEIFITIDTAFQTLSNGLLVSTVDNHDGTKTDYWKQSLAAAPYLTMLAIGKYAVVKDKWKNKEVSYYIEPPYEKYARLIFGNTPEMIEFFSNKLGIEYPWEKFSQVVVRDYVSGAMENTTAVVHGEYLQQDSREYLDNTYEDVIAHELFHHWFGDLVTCESWSNVPLNESFATYGQYLWNEYKYGREEADYGLQQDLLDYLALGRVKSPDLIRFDYHTREDMFDVVSYEKGGRIIHMLRKLVGDDAFFASLKLYLQTYQFKTVEGHQLRLAFEEVTGQDLNWFFNQWFYNGGHPELNISYFYNDSLQQQFVYTEQIQDFEKTLLYNIPLKVDLYLNGNVIREEIVIKHVKDTFAFKVPVKPLLVNFDAEKMLVAAKNDQHSIADWINMYKVAPLYLDRFEALSKLAKNYKAASEEARIIQSALQDKFWNLRILAIKNIGELASADQYKKEVKTTLINLAEHDSKSAVRSAALKSLAKYYKNDTLTNFFKKATNDSSYEVMGEAIRNYIALKPEEGLQWVKQFENTENLHISGILAGIYADAGNDDQNEYFMQAVKKAKGFDQYQIVSDYARFLSRCNISSIESGYLVIADVARNTQAWWIRLSGMQSLADLSKTCEENASSIKLEIADAALTKKSAIEIQQLEYKQKKFDALKDKIISVMLEIKKSETDKNLLKVYGNVED